MPMRSFIEGYYRFLRFLLTALIAVLLVPVSLQILSRYVGFVPRYIWTEELARFCFIWIVLVGAMVAVRDGTHFTADFLPHPKSPRWEALVRMFADFVVFLVALIFVVWGWPLVQFGLAVPHRHHLVVRACQRTLMREPHDLVVVDDQDFRFGVHFHAPRVSCFSCP